MKLSISVIALACSLSALSLCQAQQLTDFATSNFQEDIGSDTFSWDQSAGSLTFTGAGISENTLAGNLLIPLSISDIPELHLTASILSENPQATFTLFLFDDQFGGRAYTGNTNAFGLEATTVALTLDSTFPVASNFELLSIWIIFDGSLASDFSMTLTSLEAIPEPSVPLLIGFGVAATLLLRRRRRAAGGALAA